MVQFDIIGALRTYSASKGWKFIYGFDNFYKNIESTQDYSLSELVLVTDFKANPIIKNGRIVKITYTCLLMLGSKFDANGILASLDETSEQKYDRRLLMLAQTLANGIAEFACSNELTVSSAEIVVEPNVYNANIDFAISNNTTFIQ